MLPERHMANRNLTSIGKDRYERWLIYDSYVHMTNNRSGVLNRDEGYLGYLMAKSVELLIEQAVLP